MDWYFDNDSLILIRATRFFELEKGWHFGDATHFMFISITTVGFGDIVPKEYQVKIEVLNVTLIGNKHDLDEISCRLVEDELPNLLDRRKRNV